MKQIMLLLLAALAVFAAAGLTINSLKTNQIKLSGGLPMKITSSAYSEGQIIPQIYTCDGKNINPPFEIGDIPANSDSLAFILDDLDSPRGIFTHWLFWNVDPKKTSLSENNQPDSVKGKNTFGLNTYGGPCPSVGKHRYVLTVYALDIKLTLPEGADKTEFEKAIAGHILGQGQLTGVYERNLK